jgi:hypothetical protein
MMEFQLGSISSGTLRNQDLIPAMLNTLDTLVDKDTLESTYKNLGCLELVEYWNGHSGEVVCTDEDSDYWTSEDASYDYDVLVDALQECCPPYVHFGTNEGDGADFGFWPDIDRINEDIANAEYHNGDDILLLEEMVLVTVNDHGNVTVRDIWSHDILWSCV